MNKFILKGRVTKNAERKKTSSGKSMALFTLAVFQTRDITNFINLKAFGDKADAVSEYFTKGKEVLVEGYISTGSYEKDGKKLYTTDFIVNNYELCGSKEQNEQTTLTDAKDFVEADDGEDLPF